MTTFIVPDAVCAEQRHRFRRKVYTEKTLPSALRHRNQWLLCDHTKRPLCLVNKYDLFATALEGECAVRGASVNEPDDWMSFSDIRRLWEWSESGTIRFTEHGNEVRIVGIGFVLDHDDPYVCIDLDDCIDSATGALSSTAQAVLAKTDATYVEISQSGRGLHIFGMSNRRSLHLKQPGVEVYSVQRFMAMTGNRLPGAVVHLDCLDAAVDHAYALVNRRPPKATPTLDDLVEQFRAEEAMRGRRSPQPATAPCSRTPTMHRARNDSPSHYAELRRERDQMDRPANVQYLLDPHGIPKRLHGWYREGLRLYQAGTLQWEKSPSEFRYAIARGLYDAGYSKAEASALGEHFFGHHRKRSRDIGVDLLRIYQKLAQQPPATDRPHSPSIRSSPTNANPRPPQPRPARLSVSAPASKEPPPQAAMPPQTSPTKRAGRKPKITVEHYLAWLHANATTWDKQSGRMVVIARITDIANALGVSLRTIAGLEADLVAGGYMQRVVKRRGQTGRGAAISMVALTNVQELSESQNTASLSAISPVSAAMQGNAHANKHIPCVRGGKGGCPTRAGGQILVITPGGAVLLVSPEPAIIPPPAGAATAAPPEPTAASPASLSPAPPEPTAASPARPRSEGIVAPQGCTQPTVGQSLAADVLMLVDSNPGVRLPAVREWCARYHPHASTEAVKRAYDEARVYSKQERARLQQTSKSEPALRAEWQQARRTVKATETAIGHARHRVMLARKEQDNERLQQAEQKLTVLAKQLRQRRAWLATLEGEVRRRGWLGSDPVQTAPPPTQEQPLTPPPVPLASLYPRPDEGLPEGWRVVEEPGGWRAVNGTRHTLVFDTPDGAARAAASMVRTGSESIRTIDNPADIRPIRQPHRIAEYVPSSG